MELVKDSLEGSSLFLVGLKVTSDNRIFIDIDGDNGVTIDDCITLSRAVENSLNRDEEDFELNVSSAGADSPLKMPRQYVRHIGRTLAVETTDGERKEGVLKSADSDGIEIETPGTKRHQKETLHYDFNQIKTACVVVKI